MEDNVYLERLHKELEAIHEKGFEDYFHIVANLVGWAKKEMMVGPARGSSCSSLVCYLIGITDIDPIPYGLIFERFIDITRMDIPDIDIDFSDQHRYKVLTHLEKEYGKEHVSKLGTIALYRPRSVLNDIAGALSIPPWKMDNILDSMITRSSGDARAMDTLEDTLTGTPAGQDLLKEYPQIMEGVKLEGHPTHASTHASAIVLSSTELSKIAPINRRTGALEMDKKDAERIELLKIDVLGLTQLSILEDTLEMAGLPKDHLYGINMEDQKAFDILNNKKWTGVFQFNGPALQNLCKGIVATELNDLVSITALARPGPLVSGNSEKWVAIRSGREKISYSDPLLEPFLEDTFGIIIYQEQVMNICRGIGGLSWGDVNALRQTMSKSLGAEYFNQFGDPWKKGAIESGVDPSKVDSIWDALCVYGSWAFNKSHSVAYGIISYWCCWLKAYFPLEFAAATLTHEKDVEKQRDLLRELVKEGYEYVPLDSNLSIDKWVIKDGKLIGPVMNVKGIGPKMTEEIMSARVRNEPLRQALQKKLDTGTTPLDSLYPIRDAIQRILPDPRERNILTPPVEILNVEQRDNDYEVVVICTFSKINIRDANEAILVANRGT